MNKHPENTDLIYFRFCAPDYESVTLKPELSKAKEQQATPQPSETDRLTQQHKALSELTKQWIEEGDEQEQTQTWEYLRQVLDEDRLSNRPLFP